MLGIVDEVAFLFRIRRQIEEFHRLRYAFAQQAGVEKQFPILHAHSRRCGIGLRFLVIIEKKWRPISKSLTSQGRQHAHTILRSLGAGG